MLDDVKYDVAVGTRVLAEIGLATGVLASLGHVSMRDPENPERFVVKGRGYAVDALAAMVPEQMVVCDLDGRKVDGPAEATQCTEVKIHSCIYRTHPEVSSIVHVHPRYTVVAGVLGLALVPMCREGADLVRRPLPVYPHFKLITSEEDGMGLAETLGPNRAVLLQGHGAVTVGRSISESVTNMYQLEEQAKMNWYACCAFGRAYPGIPEALLVESDEAPSPSQLPHFARNERGAAQGADRGVYAYYAELVSRAMAS